MNEWLPKRLCLLMGFVTLLVCAQHSVAQTGSAAVEDQSSATAGSAAITEEADAQAQQVQESAADITQVAAEEEESPGRFIPTEQLSQDLGASFPVDI